MTNLKFVKSEANREYGNDGSLYPGIADRIESRVKQISARIRIIILNSEKTLAVIICMVPLIGLPILLLRPQFQKIEKQGMFFRATDTAEKAIAVATDK